MAFRVILPKLDNNMEEATLTAWGKKEGDCVEKGDVLVEVETDKVTFQVEAEHHGVLKKILAPVGATIAITRTIAVIGEEEEDIEHLLIREEQPPDEPDQGKHFYKARQEWYSGRSGPPRPPLQLSPRARKLVQEHGIEREVLQRHFGSARVLEARDIEAFLRKKKVVIYGAGLGAKQVLEIVRFLPDLEVIGLIDDNASLWGTSLRDIPVLGGFAALKEGVTSGQIESVALSFHTQVRRQVFQRLKDALDVEIQSLVDARAILSDDVEIGEGCFIEAGAIIGPGTRIGDGAIVDAGVTVCHDCLIGPHCHLAPGCTLSGTVKLEENVLVGVGAAVNTTVTVGPNVIIFPGSAVMNDVPGNVVVSGVPAHIIGQSRRGA